MVDATRHPAFDHEGDTAEPEQQPHRLAPCHALVKECHRQHGRQHWIGADDERSQSGRCAADADIAEPQVDGLVGNAEERKEQELAAAETEPHAEESRDAEDDHAGEQEPRREHDERRTIRNRKLGNGKRRRPEQAERRHHDGERQSQRRGCGRRNGNIGGAHGSKSFLRPR
jgi:hypothetical protein